MLDYLRGIFCAGDLSEEDEYSEEEDDADEESIDHPLISARPKPECADSIHPPPPYTPIAPGSSDAHDFVPRCPIIRPPVPRTVHTSVPSEQSIIHMLYPFEAHFHSHGGDPLPPPDPSTDARASASHSTHSTTPILVDVPCSAARSSSSSGSDSSCDSDAADSTDEYSDQESGTADPPPYTRYELTPSPPVRPHTHSSDDTSAYHAVCQLRNAREAFQLFGRTGRWW